MKKKRGLLFSGLLAGAAGLTWFIGDDVYRATIAPGKKETEGEPHSIASGREWLADMDRRTDIGIESMDNLRLHAVYIEAPSDGHDYALCLHAEHDEAGGAGFLAKHYYEKGYHVLVPDLRGCGVSEGGYTGYGYDDRLDVLTWIHWLIRQDPDAQIVLHGLSSGAAALLMASVEHIPQQVICGISDSSYTTLTEYMTRYLRFGTDSFLPVRLRLAIFRMMTKLRAGFDIADANPIDAVRHTRLPVLFVHAEADAQVPASMCKKLYEAAQCEREYCIVMNASHLQAAVQQPERYWSRVEEFIEKCRPELTQFE